MANGGKHLRSELPRHISRPRNVLCSLAEMLFHHTYWPCPLLPVPYDQQG